MEGHPKDNSSAVIRWALLVAVALFVLAAVYATHINTIRTNATISQTTTPTKYTNYLYGVNLIYPSGWQATPGYNYNHYNGSDGFFGINAMGSVGESIDALVKSETDPALKRYGSLPLVDNQTIAGEDARLITPSADQDPNFKGQMELIITYPKPITVAGTAYGYFVLVADKAHIGEIANSLQFIK